MKTLITTSLLLLSSTVFAGGTDTKPFIGAISFEENYDVDSLPIDPAVWTPGTATEGVIKIGDISVPIEVAPNKLKITDLWSLEGNSDGGSGKPWMKGGSETFEGGSEDKDTPAVWSDLDINSNTGDGDGGVETKPKYPLGPKPKLQMWTAPMKGGTDTVHVPVNAASIDFKTADIKAIQVVGSMNDALVFGTNSGHLIKIKDAAITSNPALHAPVLRAIQTGKWTEL